MNRTLLSLVTVVTLLAWNATFHAEIAAQPPASVQTVKPRSLSFGSFDTVKPPASKQPRSEE